MIDTGIRKTTIIESESHRRGNVSIIETVNIHNISHDELIDMWKQIHPAIVESGFNDISWVINNKYGDTKNHISFEKCGKLSDAVRKFAVVRFYQNKDPQAEAGRLKSLISFIQVSAGFNDNKSDKIIMSPKDFVYGATEASEILLFMDFAGIDNEDYRYALSTVTSEDKARDIPSFGSVLLFDSLMQRYIKEDFKGGPYEIVVLWWELTKIIPIRPIEFFTLKKNCIFEKNGKKYIHIDRAKQQPGIKKQVAILEDIQISEYLFILFNQFIQRHKDILQNNNYLFSADLYRFYYPSARLSRKGFMGRDQLYFIFREFFLYIISKKYGYQIVRKGRDVELADNEIERIQPGDSRHIAFINMLLQNISPYTIAQIGGHTTINQQLHYFRHLEPFLTSKAYALSKNYVDGFKDLGYGWTISEKQKESITQIALYKEQLKGMRRIDIGYCTSDNFPYECEYDDCLYCPLSILDGQHSDYLQHQKAKLISDLHTKVSYLTAILTHPDENQSENNERATLINSINSTTNQLATLYMKEKHHA